MDLNKRQLQILVVLRNKNHWITSEELSTRRKSLSSQINVQVIF